MGSYWLDALGRLPESIKTGDKSPDPRFDGDFFHFLEQNKEAGVLFDNSMMELTRSFVPAILAEYDFSGCGHIVDVGGGTGFLLYSILEQYPHVEGTLFDVPGVIEKSENKPTDKCRYISGNFFESVPATGDLYILKLILHDWNDGKCIQILKNCRKAMQPGNKLLLLEFTINEDFESQFVRIYLDLLMMVMLNGQERSAGDLNTLLDASGFRMTRLIPTRSTINIVEAVAS
jgi:hypothetical protein